MKLPILRNEKERKMFVACAHSYKVFQNSFAETKYCILFCNHKIIQVLRICQDPWKLKPCKRLKISSGPVAFNPH